MKFQPKTARNFVHDRATDGSWPPSMKGVDQEEPPRGRMVMKAFVLGGGDILSD